MMVDSQRLERLLREEKAAAFQRRQNADDRGAARQSTFEAGRVAGLRVALAILEQEAAAVVPQVARSA